MDSGLINQLCKPERLRFLASKVAFPRHNTLLHQFVLDNSHPNTSGSESYVNAVLRSMSDVSVNALNADGHTALHLSVVKNNLLMVKKLLFCLVNINVNESYDPFERELSGTALHLAARLGYSDIIKELLRKGAGIDIKNRNNDTALGVAARSGGSDVIKLLVQEGADVNLKCERDMSPLCHAVHSENLEAVEALVSGGAEVKLDDSERNPLWFAVDSGNLAIVEFLVGNGADVNGESGWNALCHAARKGHLDILKFVLDRRKSTKHAKSFHAKRENGDTMLHLAVVSGSLETVEFFISNGSDIKAKNEEFETPLHYAVNSRDTKIAAFLIDEGADLGVWDYLGRTPLHNAVYFEDLEMITLLIDKGADIVAEDGYGRTPLHYAIYEGNLEVLKYLIDRGANWHVTDRDGKSLLHYAVHESGYKIAVFLLDQGATVNAADKVGRTPLHDAVSSIRSNLKIVELLIASGADLQARDGGGKTPLHCALRGEIAALLLDRGAHWLADMNGRTPLDVAVYEGRADVIRTLPNRGADVEAEDEQEETELVFAEEKQNKQSYLNYLTLV